MSLIIDDCETVISTFNLTFSVGGSNHLIVDGVNLCIPRGKIYSLLGPSGCGKTTLLRCVVGYLKPNCGEILLFNKTHQSDDLHIPGKNVGYMPQESGLFEYMTISETLFYYGRIYQMSKDDVKRRISEIITQLELPPENQKIYNLSGGQQRRVSFAIALIHCPPLIILDEPTSGVDPVLREKIWTLLIETSHRSNSTIIITTHYIEEARRSDLVGFMRDGKILHQNSPVNLLEKYSTLEKAFLDVCLKDIRELDVGQLLATNSSSINSNQQSKRNITPQNHQSIKSQAFFTKLSNNCRTWLIIFCALFWRYSKYDLTSFNSFIFQYGIPVSQVLLAVYGVGGPPLNVNLGVVNYETDARISQQFISSLGKNFFSLHHYISIEDASKDLEANKLHSIVHIQNGFTEAFLDRLYESDLTNFAANKSNIIIIGDISDQMIHLSIIEILERKLTLFAENVLTNRTNSYHNGNFITDPPIKILKPIHDYIVEDGQSLRNAFFVGTLVNVIYTSSFTMFILIMINERKSQSFERNSVAGIEAHQIFLAIAISRTLFMVPMIIITTILPIKAVSLPITMISVLKSMPLLIAVGASGITIGMIIVTITDSFGRAVSLAIAFSFSLFFTNGSIWPLESLNIYLRSFFSLGPITMPIKALLNICYKNAEIFHDQSLMAFAIVLSYTIVALIIAIKFFRK